MAVTNSHNATRENQEAATKNRQCASSKKSGRATVQANTNPDGSTDKRIIAAQSKMRPANRNRRLQSLRKRVEYGVVPIPVVLSEHNIVATLRKLAKKEPGAQKAFEWMLKVSDHTITDNNRRDLSLPAMRGWKRDAAITNILEYLEDLRLGVYTGELCENEVHPIFRFNTPAQEIARAALGKTSSLRIAQPLKSDPLPVNRNTMDLLRGIIASTVNVSPDQVDIKINRQ